MNSIHIQFIFLCIKGGGGYTPLQRIAYMHWSVYIRQTKKKQLLVLLNNEHIDHHDRVYFFIFKILDRWVFFPEFTVDFDYAKYI